MTKPQLYLINGPLGAGKTTFLRKLLKEPQFKDARVIENEFASTSIDTQTLHDHTAEVQTIAGVCICCGTGEELIEALRALSVSEQPVVIEATGVANSLKLLEKLVVGDMLSVYELKHAVFVLDGLEVTAETLDVYGDELRAADTLLVSKLDLVDDDRKKWLTDELVRRGVTDFKQVLHGDVDLSFLGTETKIIDYYSDFDGEIRSHDDSTNYTVLSLEDQQFDIKNLEATWAELQDSFGLRRLKGNIVDTTGVSWHIEATPKQFRSEQQDAPIQLVLIGKRANEITAKIFMEAYENA